MLPESKTYEHYVAEFTTVGGQLPISRITGNMGTGT